MPRANAISRFLSDLGQTRASFRHDRILGLEIFTAGFKVTNLDDGSVRVEYLLQNRRNGRQIAADDMTERADRRKALAKYAELLSAHWAVTRRTEDAWTYLIVE